MAPAHWRHIPRAGPRALGPPPGLALMRTPLGLFTRPGALAPPPASRSPPPHTSSPLCSPPRRARAMRSLELRTVGEGWWACRRLRNPTLDATVPPHLHAHNGMRRGARSCAEEQTDCNLQAKPRGVARECVCQSLRRHCLRRTHLDETSPPTGRIASDSAMTRSHLPHITTPRVLTRHSQRMGARPPLAGGCHAGLSDRRRRRARFE